MIKRITTEIAHSAFPGLDEYAPETGDKFYVDRTTGERIECINVDMPVGSKIVPPRRAEADNKYTATIRTREYNGVLSFFFAKDTKYPDSIRPQTLARLFFVATYLRFGDNRLFSHEGTPLKKADLPGLMRLGGTAFKEFWNETAGRYLFPQEDGSIRISDIFVRGALPKVKNWEDRPEYQKIFIKSLRELYLQTPTKQHRYLGYLFAVIPWVHWQFNVLCLNPDEPDRTKVRPISLEEFCTEIKIGLDQRQRFITAFQNLKFTVNSTIQYLCAYFSDKVSGKSYLVVNPSLIYRGDDRSKVEGFGIFFPSIEQNAST